MTPLAVDQTGNVDSAPAFRQVEIEDPSFGKLTLALTDLPGDDRWVDGVIIAADHTKTVDRGRAANLIRLHLPLSQDVRHIKFSPELKDDGYTMSG